DFLKDKPLFEEVADEMLAFFGDSTLIAHNASFDIRFINAELARLGRRPIDMGVVVDTLQMARRKFPMAPATLDALCSRFSIDTTKRDKHGALVDSEQGCLWMGHGFRSDLRAAQSLASLLDIEVVPLGLVDPRFYHLDTCFCPLPGGGAMYVPTAFDARSRSAIEARVPRSLRLTLTEEEAAAFTCNAVVLGDRIFMNRRTERVAHQLEHFGLQVHPVAMDEFIKAGGSARCLTLRLDVPAHGLRRIAEEWRVSA
ncbi:MAG: hypothetical protein EOP08_06255, partial [Proteobacteria bacterium]